MKNKVSLPGELATYWPQYRAGALPVRCEVDSWTPSGLRVRILVRADRDVIVEKTVKQKYLWLGESGLLGRPE